MNFMEAQTTKKCTAGHTKKRGLSLYETLNDEARSKKVLMHRNRGFQTNLKIQHSIPAKKSKETVLIKSGQSKMA